jgi:hypothetical protein
VADPHSGRPISSVPALDRPRLSEGARSHLRSLTWGRQKKLGAQKILGSGNFRSVVISAGGANRTAPVKFPKSPFELSETRSCWGELLDSALGCGNCKAGSVTGAAPNAYDLPGAYRRLQRPWKEPATQNVKIDEMKQTPPLPDSKNDDLPTI